MKRLFVLFVFLFSVSLLSARPVKNLALFYVIEGNAEKPYNALVEKELPKIGYVMADPHHRVNDQYEEKYGSTTLDVLSFLPTVNDDLVMKLFNVDPRLAGFSPFNMLIYKKKSDSVTHVGHLTPEAMLDILGIDDPKVTEPFIESFKPLDMRIETYFKSKGLHFKKVEIPYHNETKPKMMNFVYRFETPDDMDEFLESFQNKFELAFIDKGYLIAGFHNFMDTDNADELLKDFDAFWSYSLCHLGYSYAVFDNAGARPDAGLFAPCTMYVYIKKGENKMVVGMPRLANVKETLGIKDPKRIAWMDKLDKEIPQIMHSLGMKAVENVNPLTSQPKEIAIDMTPPVDPSKISSISDTHSGNQTKKGESGTKRSDTGDQNDTVHIVIPKPPVPPKPVQISTENANDMNLRNIKFSKRYPPGYVPVKERFKNMAASKKTADHGKAGEVTAGRVSAYLQAPYMDLTKAKETLQKAGFKILAVMPLTKKEKDLHVIVFTNDTLEQFAAKHNAEFLANLRMLVDNKEKRISITNPIYFAKAFMGEKYDASVPKALLKTITSHFKGLKNSDDKLKFQQLPHYRFMNGMPEYKDMEEVALGDDLVAATEGKKQIVFTQKLSNGATLIGVKFRRRTQKFPYRIGTKNALVLPYPILVKNGKAYIMDPKYYIALMYPSLKMSEFMTIATVPDAILKECQRVFRKRK